ncbi:hypothetical protein lerEdw1_017488 [Lerista edwardsae]|nr:hypothetical protein lerEdw1_017488 [Lerista edwardsae]
MSRRLSLSVFLLLPLLWAPVCQYAAGSGLNVTEQEHNMPISRTLNTPRAELSSSGANSEDLKELMVPQFLVGDSKRAVPQIKKSAKTENGKKNSKKRGNKGKKNKNKVQSPCEGEFKNYCVHGKCVHHHQKLKEPTCICHSDYFGERCVERFLKSHTNNDASTPSIVTVVWTVVPSVLVFAAIVIIVIVQVREKCPKYDEKEERKKLRQESGSSSIDV